MRTIPSNGRRRPDSRARGRAAGACAAALCACLLAGCGGSSKASGSGGGGGASTTAAPPVALPADRPQRPACDLVTQAEVEAAIGSKVGAGKGDLQTARSVCAFQLVAAPDQSVVVVSTSSSAVPAAFEATRAKVEAPQSVNAGDQAFVAGNQGVVRKGTTMVAILLAVRQQAAAQLASAATRLLQAAGARL